nr:MAG TPA: distal tail protein [Caudoviricetes sp.]
MEMMTFHVNSDRRQLAGTMDKDVLNINWSDSQYNWIQARQYDSALRQVMVQVYRGDGTADSPEVPFDLTGCNVVLEGVLPDKMHRIYDSKHCVMLDTTGGQFRFDFPAQAFAVAGSYSQIFFRIMKDGQSIATLEFNMEIMADRVISGLIPSDYITPFNDLYDKLSAIIANADGDLKKFKETWDATIKAFLATYTKDFNDLQDVISRLESRVQDIIAEVKANDVVTMSMLARYAGCPVMIGVAHLELDTNNQGLPDIYPSVHAYAGKYGAGIGGAGETPAGGSTVYDVNVRAVRNEPTEVELFVSPDNIHGFMSDLDMADPDASFGGSFVYVYSGIFTIVLEFKGATVTKFDVASDFVANFKDTQPAKTTSN